MNLKLKYNCAPCRAQKSVKLIKNKIMKEDRPVKNTNDR